jgi:uncharacterized Fe-S cluster-containing radical SAM superfamily protein
MINPRFLLSALKTLARVHGKKNRKKLHKVIDYLFLAEQEYKKLERAKDDEMPPLPSTSDHQGLLP